MQFTKKLVVILVIIAFVLAVTAVTSVILNSGDKIDVTPVSEGSGSSNGNVGVVIVPPVIEEGG